jgi:photosystem II PsbZ protein
VSLTAVRATENLHGQVEFYRTVISKGEKMLSILFQVVLLGLVLLSFVMVVGVPVAYASPQNWNQSKTLIYAGSGLWFLLVIAVAVLNFLVV